MMQRDMSEYQIEIEQDAGQLIAFLKENTLVVEINFNEDKDKYEVSGYEHRQEGILNKLLSNEQIKRL